MVREDPHDPDQPYYECIECGNRVEAASPGDCPECGGEMRNLDTPRDT